MSIQPLIFKNGVITAPRSPTDIADINTILGITAALNLKANLISPNLSGTPTTTTASAGTNTNQIASCAFVTTAVSAISTSNFVDLTSNQTINGTKIFSGNLQLPNNSGTSAGMLWRSGNNLEYRDGANITKILLNSAGNLSNLMDKQVALNNLVNGQVANRVLRSDGTNVTLSQVNLSTDTTGNLPISLGGTGSSTQNFVDLTTNQSIAGIKTFSSGIILPNVAGTLVGGIWRNVDNLEYKDSSNITKVILNSAGNLSNLSDKQISLNNLVGTQTTNRVLRSNGTNVVLSQVALDTDVTNILSTTNGGTGSNTQNFVDLTTAQTIGGTKTFSGLVRISNTTESTSTTTGAAIVSGGQAIVGNLCVGGFSYLGDTTSIKTKYLTGTTGATEGSTANITHGLNVSKIISVTALVEHVTGNYIYSNYTVVAGYQYDVVVSSNIAVQLKAGNSSQILSKPVRIFIVYTS